MDFHGAVDALVWLHHGCSSQWSTTVIMSLM